MNVFINKKSCPVADIGFIYLFIYQFYLVNFSLKGKHDLCKQVRRNA
jgi:hypothetical protein